MIRFRVLGTVDLGDSQGRELSSVLRRPKLLALLAYLGIARPPGFHRRDALVALLWPELDNAHARNALRQAVHALRKALGRDVVLARGEEELAVNEQSLWCDVREFETALEAGEAERALELYRGTPLSGLHVSGVPEFERWLDEEREHVRRRACEAAQRLVDQAEAAGNAPGAARWALRLTQLSPSDETAVRQLVRLLDRAGDRAGAVRAYEEFERRLARDLELEPSAETRAVVESIRSRRQPEGAAAVARATVESPVLTLPATSEQAGKAEGTNDRPVALPPAINIPGPAMVGNHVPPRRVGRRWAVGAAVLVLLGSAAVVAGSRAETGLNPDLLAVAPFEVFQPELEVWHEGLVHILSRNLDGVGSLRTATPSVVIRRWAGRADRESARRLADRTGAGVVVFGQLLRAGRDSVRIKIAVLDARRDHILAEVDRTEHADRIDRLAESASLDMLRAITPSNAQLNPRLPSVGTKSLAALKAFLQGERHLRQFALDSAVASYDRAIALDSTFALAYRGAYLARNWSSTRFRDAEFYITRAGVLNHGLGPRDSLLVAVDSQLAGGAESNPAYYRQTRRRLALLRDATYRYPEDARFWFALGETRFHAAFVEGSKWADARLAFDRAIALDSGFAPAYIHPAQMALQDNDPDAALRYVRAYLAIPSVMPEGAGMRLLSTLLDHRSRHTPDFERAIETMSPDALYLVALAIQWWPDAEETQIQVARRVVANARAGLRGVPFDTGYALGPYLMLLADALIFRGHVQEARRVVGNRSELSSFMDLARLGAIPPDTVDAAVLRWAHHNESWAHTLSPAFEAGPCHRTMDAALWWASRKDTVSLRRLLRREDSAFQAWTADTLPPFRVPNPEFVRAALALAQGDSASALRRFLALRTRCPDASQLRDVRVWLLAAAGRDAEAAAVFDASHDRRVPAMLQRARLAERLGDRPTAVRYYDFVIQAWRRPDPELQPYVAEARAALLRLPEARRR